MKHQSEHTTKNQKVPYISPELQVYGTISELTHGAAGNVDDGLGGSLTLFSDTLPPVN